MSIVIPERPAASNPYLNRIKIIQGDITRQDVGAIVTVIPQTLEYRGEINKAIAGAAGEDLDKFVQDHLYQPRTGDVYAVPGFNLPCKHIFFCVVPLWKSDFERHDRYLLNACRKAMETAQGMGLSTIAFPPMASGKNGFPKPKAARLIMQGITERLSGQFEEVRIVCKTRQMMSLFQKRLIG